MKHTLLLISISFILFSCNDDKPEKDLSIAPLTNTATTTADSSASTASTVNDLPVQMPANLPQNVASMPQNTVPTTVTAAGMNPAHGQPGHRCDIKEGAPLSSAPARVATQPTTSSTTAPQTIAAAAPQQITAAPKTVTAKGMNPPHGEPGHRCDISVGAPLNSAPTAKPAAQNGTANITPLADPTKAAPIVPALQNTTITPAATAPKTAAAFTGKLNPAHGQPGHDCKVAVGQPLP